MFFEIISYITVNNIGESGAESISRALQSNTSLTSLVISCELFVQTPFTQQITVLEILVLRVFREHSNPTHHSNRLLFSVCTCVQTPFTQQITQLENLALQALLGHFNQILRWSYLILPLCCLGEVFNWRIIEILFV